MIRSLFIALKDLRINFRDPSGLLLMLAAPFALILVIGAAFGGLGSSNSGSTTLSDIPVVIVNLDEGEYSSYLVEAFQSEDLADLLEPQILDSVEEARALVDGDKAAAAVIVPANFSDAIFPTDALMSGDALTADPAVVEVYQNPSRSISSAIVRSIVDTILANFASGRISVQVTIEALVRSGRLSPEQINAVAPEMGQQVALDTVDQDLVQLNTQTVSAANSEGEFNWLVYMVPSMAVVYLMFTVTASGRSILVERDRGTLPRMLVMPTTATAVLGGKMLGAFITGLVQMTILLTASTLLFKIAWGSAGGLALLTVAVVAAATGWAMLIAAFSKTPGQASAIGTALTLIFSAAGGNFLPRASLPQWLRTASLITPNGWGMEGYTSLSAGNSLSAVLPEIGALLLMAAVTFFIASRLFRRQYQ